MPEQVNMPPYQPKPIVTSSIHLPNHLLELTEKLAENAHDHWANLRIKQGWSFGSHRDDTEKKHPDLIPYKDLPDSEKEYDRNTALETLKAIVALGYHITPQS